MSDETFPYASFSLSCTLSGSVGGCGGASCLVKVADLRCFTNMALSTMMIINSVTVIMKSTKVLNPRRCIMRTRNTHAQKYACAYTRNTHGKMADCTHGRTTEGVLDLCNGAVSEKTPQIF